MTKKKTGKAKKLNKWVRIVLWILEILILAVLAANFLTKEILFSGCGNNFPDYKYSLRFPLYWVFTRTSVTDSYVYFSMRGINKSFTVNCTTQGVGGDICDEKYRTKFIVDGDEYKPCFGKINGKWKMGVLNLSTDPETNATISFWAEGLNKNSIDNILSSFKILDGE